MMARRLVIAGICLAVLIAAAAIVLDQMARQGAASAQSPASSSSTPGAGAESTVSGAPTSGSTASGTEGTASGGSPTPGSGSGTEGSAAANTAKPLEVLPPVTATATGLPEPSAPAPLITGALPEPGSASGELVDGWPDGVLSLPAGTTIGSTSVSTSGEILQLTADGIIAKPQAEVLDFFRQSLVSRGFWTEEAPAGDGAMAARFVRGTDTVTVSVSTTGTGSSRFQLLGSLHTTAE
jgi:hypothetical protein